MRNVACIIIIITIKCNNTEVIIMYLAKFFGEVGIIFLVVMDQSQPSYDVSEYDMVFSIPKNRVESPSHLLQSHTH